MRTYDFKKSQEFSHSNFLPIQTIVSEEFGSENGSENGCENGPESKKT